MYLFTLILLVFGLTFASGLRCSFCAYKGKATSFDPQQYNTDCQNGHSRFVKECPRDTTLCLHISGIHDGQPAGLRDCGTSEWKRALSEGQRCVDTNQVPGFNLEISGQVIGLEKGVLCVCESDECNTNNSNGVQGRFGSSTSTILLISMTLAFFLARGTLSAISLV